MAVSFARSSNTPPSPSNATVSDASTNLLEETESEGDGESDGGNSKEEEQDEELDVVDPESIADSKGFFGLKKRSKGAKIVLHGDDDPEDDYALSQQQWH